MKNKERKIQEWLELVATRKASCYIKPTRFKHESGFRTFEVGYCILDGKNKVAEKIVLRNGSDHIHTDFMGLVYPDRAMPINMDLTNDGYIRIWGSEKKVVVWEAMPMSSAELTLREYRNNYDYEPAKLREALL